MPGLDDETSDVLGLVQKRLSLDSAGRWLFILDNVDDGDMLLLPLADASQPVRLERYRLRRARQPDILDKLSAYGKRPTSSYIMCHEHHTGGVGLDLFNGSIWVQLGADSKKSSVAAYMSSAM